MLFALQKERDRMEMRLRQEERESRKEWMELNRELLKEREASSQAKKGDLERRFDCLAGRMDEVRRIRANSTN